MKKILNHKHQTILVTKANAFTLPELVVSMLLMAILFTIGATVYIIISQQSQSIHKKNSFYADYYVTKKALERDADRAFIITVSDENKLLHLQQKEQSSIDDIFYKIDTAYIVRVIGASADTLLPGGSITAIEKRNDSVPLIDFITIQHRYNSKPFYTYLQKSYSAEQLLRSRLINNTLP